MSVYQTGSTTNSNGKGYLEDIEFLIVEDNEFSRTIIRDMLQALGARNLRHAKDGCEALDEIRLRPCDIIILDWEMPVMDGIQFTKFIRRSKDSPDPFVSIIMMTGYSDLTNVMVARDAGVNEYLIKPCSAKQVLSRIRAVVENPRPYVKVGEFFGPDRRRHKSDRKYNGQDRRHDTAGMDLELNRDALHQDDVDNLFGGPDNGARSGVSESKQGQGNSDPA